MKNDGLLVVISGPAGTGKGTVVRELQKDDGIRVSVSATTRAPREGETDGVHYHFLSVDLFEQMIKDDGFLEYACYVGNYYGSPRRQAEEWMRQGKDVILEIEVQGCRTIKEKNPDCVSIFIMPPSKEELENRLRGRGTETEDVVLKRLARADEEMAAASEYDHVVVNDVVEDCAKRISDILREERQKRSGKDD